jgi:cytidylate kinase
MTNKPSIDAPFRVVAIDGGAASGKSSTAKVICRRRNFLHVDTGSHYRAVTLACLKADVSPVEGPELQRFLKSLSIGSCVEAHESRICFGGESPPEPGALRSREVNEAVSLYAALPSVRDAVRVYQQDQVEIARAHHYKGIVMDGRDIGTVILPNADLKVYLVADPSTRQNRRRLEGGNDTIAERDKCDSSRRVAPLAVASDAVVIDNSNLSLEQVVDQVLHLMDQI